MISENRAFAVVVFVIFIQTSLTVCFYYKTPAVRLSYGVFSSALPDILPYAVIERIHMEQNARKASKISSRSSIQALTASGGAKYRPSPLHQRPVPAYTHKNPAVSARLHNLSKLESRSSKLGTPAYLQHNRKNTQLLHLYDEDGEHMLNLRIHKVEDGGAARTQHRRQNILFPTQASEDSKRERHYWLGI